MEEVKRDAAEFMKPRAAWQFFEAESDGEAMHLFAPGSAEPVHTFRFPRQRVGDFLCLSDYVLTPQNGQRDHVALFVVTGGEGVRERSEKAKTKATTSNHTECRHWRSSRRKRARNGCTGVFERIGASLTRRI